MNMVYIELAAAILTLLGVGLSLLGRKPAIEFGAAPSKSGSSYLIGFATVVVLFGTFSVVFYRIELLARAADIVFTVWLLLAMIAGMFAQVLAANYRARRGLFLVS